MFKLRVEEGAPPGIYKEGKADIVVKEGVFYNIYAEQSRSIGIIFFETYSRYKERGDLLYCEPLAATGVRGIRVALEMPSIGRVCLNDLSYDAYRNILENVERNDLKGRVLVSREDANLHLLKHTSNARPDIIDIDPFGSPTPFIAAAVQSIKHGGLLAATATDIAPLCGVHGKSTFRKYHAKPIKASFCKETAIRIVLGAIARVAATFEAGIKPLASHATRHYIRVYVEVVKRPSAADSSIENIGFIKYCPKCEWRSFVRGIATFLEPSCENCGSKTVMGGPLWIGSFSDLKFLELALKVVVDLNASRRDLKLVSTLLEESFESPVYYQLDELAGKYKTSSPPVKKIVKTLRGMGYKASRTHLDPKGIRTNAPYHVLRELVVS